MRYTNKHEWVEKKGKIATFGLAKEAISELGEIVYFELPKVGDIIQKDQMVCLIESSKTATEIYSPLSGKICKVNDTPFKQGGKDFENVWLFQIEMSNPSEWQGLLSKKDVRPL
jgi:glycine cleavage system H protein